MALAPKLAQTHGAMRLSQAKMPDANEPPFRSFASLVEPRRAGVKTAEPVTPPQEKPAVREEPASPVLNMPPSHPGPSFLLAAPPPDAVLPHAGGGGRGQAHRIASAQPVAKPANAALEWQTGPEENAQPAEPQSAGPAASQSGPATTAHVAIETHFAPATPPVAAQIADAMFASDANDIVPTATPSAGTSDPVAMPSQPAIATRTRILTIDLTPESLGAVQARLRLVGGQLQVSLSAETHQAVAAIEADRSRRVERITAGGYGLDSLSIGLRTAVHSSGDAPSGLSDPRHNPETADGQAQSDGEASDAPARRGASHRPRHTDAGLGFTL